MPTCANCGTTIVVGGVKHEGHRFCSTACRKQGVRALATNNILDMVPPEILEAEIRSVHEGPCPLCGGEGPVGAHTAFMIWSVIFFERHLEQHLICCRPCGRRNNLIAALKSFFLGWWSFPEGFILTPVYIVYNLVNYIRPPDLTEPSELFRALVATEVAGKVAKTLEEAKEEAGVEEQPEMDGVMVDSDA